MRCVLVDEEDALRTFGDDVERAHLAHHAQRRQLSARVPLARHLFVAGASADSPAGDASASWVRCVLRICGPA